MFASSVVRKFRLSRSPMHCLDGLQFACRKGGVPDEAEYTEVCDLIANEDRIAPVAGGKSPSLDQRCRAWRRFNCREYSREAKAE